MDALFEVLWEDVSVGDEERLRDMELLRDADWDRVRPCDADAYCEGVIVSVALCDGDCPCVEDWLWDCETLSEAL